MMWLSMLAAELVLAASAYVLAAWLFLPTDPAGYLLYEGGLLALVSVAVTFLICLRLQDPGTRTTSKTVLLQQICLALGIAFLAQGVVSVLDRRLRLPMRVMVPGCLLAGAAVFGWRLLRAAASRNRSTRTAGS